MQPDILIIGKLFTAISLITVSLMTVNFGNRYTVLANLICNLHDKLVRDKISPQNAERFLLQINRLRDLLRLIGIVQFCAAMAFVLAQTAMIAVYDDGNAFATALFLCSITLLIVSMLLFTSKIHIANTTLDAHLLDLDDHQEWQQYLKPKRK